MTTVPVVRDVIDALGRMQVSTPMMIDESDLATYELYGWRLRFGAPVAPLEPGQIPEITKSVADVRPWTLDWSQWLVYGETLTSSQWLTSSGLTLSSQTMTTTATATLISGGTYGQSYLVTNRIISSSGRDDDQSVTVIVGQR